MDEIIQDLESKKTGDKFIDFRIDRAILCLWEARTILETDPVEFYDDSLFTAKTLHKALPMIYLIQEGLRCKSHIQTNSIVES